MYSPRPVRADRQRGAETDRRTLSHRRRYPWTIGGAAIAAITVDLQKSCEARQMSDRTVGLSVRPGKALHAAMIGRGASHSSTVDIKFNLQTQWYRVARLSHRHILTRIVDGHPNSQIDDLLPCAYIAAPDVSAVA